MPQLTNVQKNEVGITVQGYVEQGYGEVVAKKQADGKWTVTAN